MKRHLSLCISLVVLVLLACSSGPSPNPDPPIPDPDPPTPTPPTVPAAPSQLKYTSLSSTEVELQWKDNSNNETGFRVLRDSKVVTTTDRNNFTDQTVKAATKYLYQVAAFNDQGESRSNTLTVTTHANVADLAQPTNVAVDRDFHRLILTWKDNSSKETNYVVKRSDGAEEKLDPDTEKYVDENLPLNTTYSYEIYAENASGKSAVARIEGTTRGSFKVRWNRAMDRKEADGQLVANGWAKTYELTVTPQPGGAPFVAYTGSDTSFVVEIDKPFCASVRAIDLKGNVSPESEKACSD